MLWHPQVGRKDRFCPKPPKTEAYLFGSISGNQGKVLRFWHNPRKGPIEPRGLLRALSRNHPKIFRPAKPMFDLLHHEHIETLSFQGLAWTVRHSCLPWKRLSNRL